MPGTSKGVLGLGEGFAGLRAVARVLIMNAAGEVLLCRSRSGKAWVPPGGTLEQGETLALAAAREAVEEAGLSAEVGALIYLQEFRPVERAEHVIEVAFLARALQDRPPAERQASPAGPAKRPWAAWVIQDLDGPRREVRWFAREQVAALAEPVYPAFLRQGFWEAAGRPGNPYLGLVEGR
jgi:8-oxo-dGTP diphosphatase